MKPLWEAEHPYYANEGNYFSNDCHEDYDDWPSFIEDEGNSDIDMNLVYRWDWKEGEDWGIPEGESHLCLYFIGQRKALARSVTVRVSRDDEQAIIEFLRPRLKRLMEIWKPLSEPADETSAEGVS